MPNIEKSEYNALVEDIRSVYTERVYNARSEMVKANIEVGELIANHSAYKKHGKGNFQFLQQLAKDIKGDSEAPIGKTMLYNCIQLYEHFHTYEAIEDQFGKLVSMNRAMKTIAPPKEDKEPDCRHCKIHCN